MDTTDKNQGIVLTNAGLVILNAYFKVLFERLGFVKDDAFVSAHVQADAVHYLQYIASGHTATQEAFLNLNKLLVGLPLGAPVPTGVEMTNDQKQLIEGMIQAAISHWSAIGESSVDGFRGNWLVRDGVLREFEDRWELTVDKKAYDLLLLQSPFSFSIIKYAWMPKPLHVSWDF